MAEMLDLRCPIDQRRMFGRIRVTKQVRFTEGNLIEFACPRCRKTREKTQVLHRFDFSGRLVETVEVP